MSDLEPAERHALAMIELYWAGSVVLVGGRGFWRHRCSAEVWKGASTCIDSKLGMRLRLDDRACDCAVPVRMHATRLLNLQVLGAVGDAVQRFAARGSASSRVFE